MNKNQELYERYIGIQPENRDIEDEYNAYVVDKYLSYFKIPETNFNLIVSKLINAGVDMKTIQEPYMKRVEERDKEYNIKKGSAYLEILQYVREIKYPETEEMNVVDTFSEEYVANYKAINLHKIGYRADVVKSKNSNILELISNVDIFYYKLLKISSKI